jgi:deoxyribonuclease-4
MIGIHIDSNPDKLLSETERVYKMNGRIIQMFVNTSNNNNKIISIYKKLNKLLIKKNMKCVVHISYTINCSQNWNEYSWWILQFIIEINQANIIGAFAVVIHLGKQLNLSYEEAINNMYMSLLYVHSKTKQYDIKILIETSSGQGSEICYELDKLEHFYKKFSKYDHDSVKNRFGICLDTCHIFSAGYNIKNVTNIKSFLKKFNKLIGLEHIKLIHLNDSKNDVGSHIDRHENIGQGYIGKKSLLYIFKIFNKSKVPIILETPDNNLDKLEKIEKANT